YGLACCAFGAVVGYLFGPSIAARLAVGKKPTGLRLVLKGVAPWKPLPAPVASECSGDCWREPFATRKDAHRAARARRPLWDIRVWQCGPYWHHGSRRAAARIRRFLEQQANAGALIERPP